MHQCPVCLAETKLQFVEKHGDYTINRCPACDVVFSDPMKNPGADWYEKSEMYAVGRVLHTAVGWQHNQFILDKDTYGKRLLDVGCGPGAFLSEAKKKGYEVWGLDFDRENVKVAKKRFGLKNIYAKSVADLARDFSGQKFDVITFFEVLEHLDDPTRFMGEIRGILESRGHIALSLPNRDRTLDPLGEGDYPPNHLTRWNRECLTAFLERNGFEVVKCVVKRFDSDDLAGYLKSKIRFGIAKGIAKSGIESNNQKEIRKAASLMGMKDMIFKGCASLFSPLLSVLSLQGAGLYVLARSRE